MSNLQFQNDLNKLLEVLPPKVRQHVDYDHMEDVIEIVLDIGRTPEIRHSDGKIEYIGEDTVNSEDIEYITSRIQEFTSDNRSGIPGTLHRISAIRNRQGKVIGLTCRIGRVVTGTIACIKDATAIAPPPIYPNLLIPLANPASLTFKGLSRSSSCWSSLAI